MSENKRVLAVMPHPDDMEILCAGTLIRLSALGFAVHVAVMTAGDKGSDELPRAEIAAIRRTEAQKGAALIGAASCRCLEFADLEIIFDNAARQTLAGLVREIDPLLVMTTPPFDYMMDHIVTSTLVRDACFNAGCRNYFAEGTPTIGAPYLYYTDAVGGTDLFGQETPVSSTFDITAQMGQKAAALECHDSQRAWLRRQHGLDDYVGSMRSWAAKRGSQIGVTYAESWVQHRGHPHPSDDILAALLAPAA